MRHNESDSEEENPEFGGDCKLGSIYRPGLISEILPGELYVSDMIAANDLRKLKLHGIKGVIALGGLYEQMSYLQHKDPDYPIEYYHIYIEDAEVEPIKEYFEDTAWFIDKLAAPVLVHCWMGISRSSSIAIAYLIKMKDMTYTEAVNYVQDRRTFICPNQGFLEQLEQYAIDMEPQKRILPN
jgi:protein-tyrosine phosphatase